MKREFNDITSLDHFFKDFKKSAKYQEFENSISKKEFIPVSRGAIVKKYNFSETPNYINILIPDSDSISSKDLKMKKKLDMMNQKNFAYMERYAQSLSGGKIVLRDIIVKPEDPKKNAKSKQKGKNKEKKEDAIKRANEEKNRKKNIEKLKLIIKALNKTKDCGKKINSLDNYLSSVSDPKIALTGQFQLLSWCLEESIEPPFNPQYISKTVSIAFDIYRRFFQSLSEPESVTKLLYALRTCGFSKSSRSIFAALTAKFPSLSPAPASHSSKEGKGKKDIWKKSRPITDIGLPLSEERFQLCHGGPLMVRNVDSTPDPRVASFYPDRWQRELLDRVDRNESVLVVAPTSSGKTFITYYALKRHLAANRKRAKKALAVYCAPNKALVNQAAGDIYKRFGNVFGEYTEEYSMNFEHCEVLITLPRRLEELLTNSAFSEVAARVSTLIVDEVHCLDDPEAGHYYQRVFSFVACQFVALSATVGDSAHFRGWLEKLSGKRVALVEHYERWSDIEKMIYVPRDITDSQAPPLDPEVDNVLEYQFRDVQKLFRLHPAVILALRNTPESRRAFFSASLSAEEAYRLYAAIERYNSSYTLAEGEEGAEGLGALVERFKPENYFRENIYITKLEAKSYSQSLVAAFSRLPAPAVAAVSALIYGRLNRIERLRCSTAQLLSGFTELLLDLRHRDLLPALVFCLDRSLCERLLEAVLLSLEEMEARALKSEQSALRKQRKAEEKARKLLKRRRDQDPLSLEDMDPVELEEQEQALGSKDKGVDPRFTFVKPGEHVAPDELKFWLEKAKRKTKWGNGHPLLRAVHRGLGVHHEGFSKGYRHLVETLFRYKHVRAVICTGSLAMGVNMPCKTTVFAGDSEDLTPVSYRQMMGRAGRRGFDNVGYVVFYGVPLRKATALMASRIRNIQGHNVWSPLTFLKLLSSPSSPSSTSGGGRGINWQYYTETDWRKVFFRESVEFLTRMGLLHNSHPQGLWRIVYYLEEFEFDSYLFIDLLREGYFHSLAAGFNRDRNGKGRSLLLLKKLSLIFLRRPLPDYNSSLSERVEYGEVYLRGVDEEVFRAAVRINDLAKGCFKGSRGVEGMGEGSVPRIALERSSGWPAVGNNFVVDFYSHRSYKTLQRENMFGEELWVYLKKWSNLINRLLVACCEYKADGFSRNKNDFKKIEISDAVEDDFLKCLFYLNEEYQSAFDSIGADRKDK